MFVGVAGEFENAGSRKRASQQRDLPYQDAAHVAHALDGAWYGYVRSPIG